MSKLLNTFLIDDDSDDENIHVDWSQSFKQYYNCGCCDDCLCDFNKSCKNCKCECNCDDLDNYSDSDDNDSTIESSKPSNLDNNTKLDELMKFNINIIEDSKKEKKVRLTLEFNVNLNNRKEVISIDVDINSSTYLKIAEELFKINN